MYDLILKNAIIVTAEKTFPGSVAVRNGKIAAIPATADDAKRIIDLGGKYLLPGVIDGHIHCMCPFMGCQGPNDFYRTGVAAAFGGVTTLMDFTNSKIGTPVTESIEEKKELMKNCPIDYAIHAKLVEGSPDAICEIDRFVEMGVPTFKMFMTYRRDGIMCDDDTLIRAFKRAVKAGALPLLHCESNAIAEAADEEFEAKGELTWHNFAVGKPPICEAEAFNRAYSFAKVTGCPIMVVHTTVKDAFDIARRAHRENFPLYVETCPHYMTLFKDIYDREDGYLAICSPPLRTPKDAADIWDAIMDQTVSITGSDDCTYTKEEKSRFLKRDKNGKIIQDYRVVVNGNSGIETRFPILLSEGVSKGRISINTLVKITSANIAKIYGCYPQKGEIAVGSDADFTVVDMDKEVTLSADVLHNNLDYCLYDGMKLKGYPVMTISRGEVVVENEKFVGEAGHGRFVFRKLSKDIVCFDGLGL